MNLECSLYYRGILGKFNVPKKEKIMKISKGEALYPIWGDGHKRGKIEGMRRSLIALKESNYDKNEFEEILQKEIDSLIRSEFP